MDILECCDICGDGHTTELCPELGLNSSHIEFDLLSTRARLTLPKFLEVVDNGDGLVGVVAKETIAAKTQLGPYEAKRTTHIFDDVGFFTLKLIAKDGTTVCLDTTDENECNWLCLVRAATSEESQNCMAYQLGSNIFYNTTREIFPGEEVQVWYAPHFGRKLGKPSSPDGQTRVLLGHRIEPLTSELLGDTDAPSSQHVTGSSQPTVSAADIPIQPLSDNEQTPETTVIPEMTRGEIRKAFYCPRCGHTFDSQTEMVQHLREHVIGNTGKTVNGKRGRGRPRIHFTVVGETGTPKRARGRPRKSDTPQVGLDRYDTADDKDQSNLLKIPVKSHVMKRKRTSVDNNDEENESDIEETDDEDDSVSVISEKRLKIDVYDDDLDVDYTPVKEVQVAPTRVQPRRSNRGKHSKFDEDYVVGKIGKKIKEEIHNGDYEDDGNDKGLETLKLQKAIALKDASSGTPGKKGRGRPRINRDNNVTMAIHVAELEKRDTKEVETLDEMVNISDEGIAFVGIDSVNVERLINDAREISVVDVAGQVNGVDKEDISNDDLADFDLPDPTLVIGNTESKLLIKVESNPSYVSINSGSTINIDGKMVAPSASDFDQKKLDNVEIDADASQGNITINQTELTGEDDMKSGVDVEVRDNVADEIEGEGKMVVMFEESNDKMFSCVLCGEKFNEEIEAISHFMNHKKGSTTCRKCQMELKDGEELSKHIENCSGDSDDVDYDAEILDSNGDEHLEHSGFMDLNKQYETIDTNGEILMKEHSGDKPASNKSDVKTGEKFTCDICHQAFKSAQYLYRHMVMHTDVFNCIQCKKTFSRKDSLQKHVLKCCPHLAETYKIHSCNLCYRVFSTLTGKAKHMKKCKSVQCQECRKVFSSKDDLGNHSCGEQLNDDATVGKYSCGICPKSFQSLYYLKAHRVLHEGIHSCEKCKKSLPSAEELEEHKPLCETIETIKSLGIGKCDKCDEEFNSAKVFREHYLSHSHPYQCEECSRRFVKIGTLSSHNCQMTTLDSFICQVCSRSFKNKLNLDRHTKDHGCFKYLCSACGKQFHMKYLANEHVCVGDGNPETRIIEAGGTTYECSACGTRFPVQELALEHHCEGGNADPATRTIHQLNVKEVHVCSTCGKSFSTRSNLTKHMLLHGEKHYVCQHCDKRFHLEVYLKEHITCVHYNIYKFQCTDCGKMLKSKTGLIAHSRLFHAKNLETYPCQQCGKIFRQKGNLRTHMYSHSNERKFSCNLCERAYKYPDQLSRHKLEHKIINKLECPHCDKQFLREYEMKRHLQIYHSGYTYVCGVCSSRCGHRHTLVRHYKRKHAEEFHLLSQEGYLDSLLKQVNDGYPNQDQINASYPPGGVILQDGDQSEQVQQINSSTDMLPRDAAEALNSLALGTVTSKQYNLLHAKGLFKNVHHSETDQSQTQHISLINNQTVVVSQSGDVLQGQGVLQHDQIITDGGANISGVSLDGTIGMIQNADGTITINGLSGIPQTIDGLDGGERQIVILQIVDPESQEHVTGEVMQGEIIQDYQGGEIIQAVTEQIILQNGQDVPMVEHVIHQMEHDVMQAEDVAHQTEQVIHQTEHDVMQAEDVAHQTEHVIHQTEHDVMQADDVEEQTEHVIVQTEQYMSQNEQLEQEQVEHVMEQTEHVLEQTEHVIEQTVHHHDDITQGESLEQIEDVYP